MMGIITSVIDFINRSWLAIAGSFFGRRSERLKQYENAEKIRREADRMQLSPDDRKRLYDEYLDK